MVTRNVQRTYHCVEIQQKYDKVMNVLIYGSIRALIVSGRLKRTHTVSDGNT